MLFPLAVSDQATGYLFMLMMIVGSSLLAYGIYQAYTESRKGTQKKILDRMKGLTHDGKSKASSSSILRQNAAELDAGSALHTILSKLSFVPKFQITIDQANLQLSATRLLVHLFLAATACFVIMFFMGRGLGSTVGISLCVFYLPILYISMRRKSRMKRFTYQLPDVFAMMSQALRAGHSLASAIQLIHEQMPDPIGTEFGRVFHEQNLGIKIEDALLAMANRVDQLDVRFFVTAVLIQRQTGGDLAEVLDKISSVIRERIELFAMVLGLTAEGRLSGWVLFALPFLVFGAVTFMNPVYASQLTVDPRGRIILGIALCMQLMGLAMIRWIVNIKV